MIVPTKDIEVMKLQPNILRQNPADKIRQLKSELNLAFRKNVQSSLNKDKNIIKDSKDKLQRKYSIFKMLRLSN
jgi:hypothetical protein